MFARQWKRELHFMYHVHKVHKTNTKWWRRVRMFHFGKVCSLLGSQKPTTEPSWASWIQSTNSQPIL